MNNISIGRYLPYDTFIHRIDPRIKLILTIFFMVSIFFVKSMYMYIPIFMYLLLAIHVAKIPIKSIIRGLRPLIYILIITAIINILTMPGKEIANIFGISITLEGIIKSIFISIRLLFIIVSTSLLTYTTSPTELTDGLEKLFSPLKKIGFPSSEIAMIISIALRFIPTLFEESQKIKLAQMSRGADFESGNFINRAKNMIPLFVPLFLNSFNRASDLAIAMESRLYRTGINRTRLNELKIKNSDKIVFVFSIFLFLIIIIIGIL